MRLLRGELLKLVKRPATRTTFLLLALAIVVVYLALGASAAALPDDQGREDLAGLLTFPDAYRSLVAIFPLFGGLALAIYAGLVIGSEWSWGTLRLAFTRGEGRVRFALTTFVAIALLAALGLVLLFGIGLAAALLAGTISGFPRGDLADAETLGWLPIGLLAAWFGAVVIGSLSYAVSLVARSQVAGIGLVVALLFGEQFAGIVLPPEVMRFAPLSAASGLVTADGVLVVAVAFAYLAVALVAGALITARAEVS